MGLLDTPISARVRNGLRFAEVNIAIVHVAGATEPPAPKDPAKKNAKRAELVPAILPEPLQPDPEGLALYLEYVTEREAIRLRKEAGQPWPWTENEILRNRFCNNERRRDRPTIEIMRLVVEPYRNHPDLVFLDIVARLHNETAALAELLEADCLTPFNPDRYYQVLKTREARGAKNYRTDAYRALLVPTSLKGMKAPEYHARIALPAIYARREYLQARDGDTLESFTGRLRECPGIDSFFAGQIAADLKYIAPLCNASDHDSFALPGPGSENGFDWFFGREPGTKWREWHWRLEMQRTRTRLLPILGERGLPLLDAQDIQNTFCEYTKYRKLRIGKGRKRPYRLAQPEKQPRKAKQAPKPAAATPIVAPVPNDPPPDPAKTNGRETEPHCLAAALAYAKRGWSIFPAPRGEKKSHKSAEHSNGRRWGATSDPDEICRDYARWSLANVGIPTGTDNGIWVLEADTKEGHDVDGIASLRALETQHGALPETLQAVSPTGSRHFYFKQPADKTITNSVSKIASGVDVRGEGGMVLAPPSIKPGVGSYAWSSDAAIAEAPDWLLQLVVAAKASAASGNGSGQREPNPDLEGALPLAKAAVAAIPNNAAGAAIVNPGTAATDFDWDSWNKLGMAIFGATGGSDEGFELFDAFSQRSAKYDSENTRDKWRLFHTSPPDRIGYGSLHHWATEANPDWLRDAAEANSAKAETQAGPSDEANASIEPVDLWGHFDPPALPRGLLPNIIEQFAIEEAELMGADPGGLALGALAVCAAALPDHIRLQVKRHDPHWLEAARLWVGLIGEPSTKKTPIILRVAKPLKRLDAELFRDYVAAQEVYDNLSSDDRKRAERPKQRRLRVEDTTIEAAQEVLKDSPDGVLAIQDELSGWFGAMDKYASQRGAAKDRGFWLQAFHGGPYAINRIKRGAALIENLSISLLGGIQPEPIRKVAADTVDDGLLQRLTPLILRPGSSGQDAPIARSGDAYDMLIRRLHDSLPPPAPLQFTDAALAIREELEHKHLDLMRCEAVNKKLAAHIGKYDGLFARLCLLWHRIEAVPTAAMIEASTARRVADFMHTFLLPHAFAFYAGMLGLSDDHERLTAVAGYILARQLDRITNRDVQRGDRTMRGLGRPDIERIFQQLDALGWVTRIAGLRPTDPPRWLVNPEVHRLFAQQAAREAAERAQARDMLKAMFHKAKEA